MKLQTSDFRQLFETIEAVHVAGSLCALRRATEEGLGRLVPADCYDLVFCDQDASDGGVFHAKPSTYRHEEIAYMLTHAYDHPIARVYQAGESGAFSISQFVTNREWRNSHIYNEGGYKRLGLRHEMAVDIPGISDRCLAVLSIARTGHDFCPREREILNIMRPHISRAWMKVEGRNAKTSPARLRELFPILTRREAEILFWIVEGKLNAEIASILERRLGTVQEHVENIICKLGMESRHHLTVFTLYACYGR